MISHELKKKCTHVHSVLVGGHVYKIHTSSSSSLWNAWLVKKSKSVTNNTTPPPPNLLSYWRPEKQKRRCAPPYWNPQMSVRQGTWLILTLGAFSQSSVRKPTRAKTERTWWGGGGSAIPCEQNGVLTFTPRAADCHLQVQSDQKHVLPFKSIKNWPLKRRRPGVFFCSTARWNSLPVSVNIIYPLIS